jgi:CRP/FNR family cyclic AMP-dependent transcriptional regulator
MPAMKDRAAEVLPPALLEQIGALATVRVFPKNALIVTEGDDSGSVYVLLSGHVKVFLSDEQGREVQLNRLGPGEYFGEVTLDGGPRSASVMALEETRCAVLRRAELLGLIERRPELALHMLRRLARRVRALSENVRSLALMDVYGRVARLLLELAEEKDGRLVIDEPLTHKEIASRVGASREMVSRIFSDLAEGGYVTKAGGRLVIVRAPPPRW